MVVKNIEKNVPFIADKLKKRKEKLKKRRRIERRC